MKEEYLVLGQWKFQVEKNQFHNVVWLASNCEKRYASSLEEAHKYIEQETKEGLERSKKSQTTEIGHSGIGVTCGPTDGLILVNTKIKKRLVSEWEEVE